MDVDMVFNVCVWAGGGGVMTIAHEANKNFLPCYLQYPIQEEK